MNIIEAVEITTDVILNPRPMSEREWLAVTTAHKVHEMENLDMTVAQAALSLGLIRSFNDVRKQRVTLRMNNEVVQEPLDTPLRWIEDPNELDHWCSLRASKSLQEVRILTPSISALCPTELWFCDHAREEVIVPEITADTAGMCCCSSPVDMCQTPHKHRPLD